MPARDLASYLTVGNPLQIVTIGPHTTLWGFSASDPSAKNPSGDESMGRWYPFRVHFALVHQVREFDF